MLPLLGTPNVIQPDHDPTISGPRCSKKNSRHWETLVKKAAAPRLVVVLGTRKQCPGTCSHPGAPGGTVLVSWGCILLRSPSGPYGGEPMNTWGHLLSFFSSLLPFFLFFSFHQEEVKLDKKIINDFLDHPYFRAASWTCPYFLNKNPLRN